MAGGLENRHVPVISEANHRAYLLSEYDRLTSEIESNQVVIQEWVEENERLTKVLGWYADKDNYDPVHLDTFGYIPIDKDEGKRAMAALSHIERITNLSQI
ncbi:hypothetical protein [Paenibacillus segetis]|uniref:Uncharacterized protein n=1 Tax=Paenibacillus segetis TaxID=1325360 RepID=A0ABQ1Y9Q3_9BACL|nr:hypothetical protein [Paenibacillus segetis]GGH16646.1 hypothetical protein GCM10008013_11540 [Paenibacillus segetis]